MHFGFFTKALLVLQRGICKMSFDLGHIDVIFFLNLQRKGRPHFLTKFSDSICSDLFDNTLFGLWAYSVFSISSHLIIFFYGNYSDPNLKSRIFHRITYTGAVLKAGAQGNREKSRKLSRRNCSELRQSKLF